MAVYSLAQFIFAPILGRISDRIGRRPVIMLGLLGSSIGYLIYGFAGSFLGLFLSRAVHGACAATISTAQAYIADTTDESNRARGMGMIGAAFGLGFVIGPAIGGLLGRNDLRIPGFFAAALTFANLIFAAMRLPESHQPEPGARIDASVIVAPIRDLPSQLFAHHLSRLFSVAFLTTFALAAFETTFAIMIPRVYGYGPTGIGTLLAFAGLMQALAQGYLLGKIVKRIGEVKLLSLWHHLIRDRPRADGESAHALDAAARARAAVARLRIREPRHREPHFETNRTRARGRGVGHQPVGVVDGAHSGAAGGRARLRRARNLGAICGWCDCRTHGIYTCARHRRSPLAKPRGEQFGQHLSAGYSSFICSG